MCVCVCVRACVNSNGSRVRDARSHLTSKDVCVCVGGCLCASVCICVGGGLKPCDAPRTNQTFTMYFPTELKPARREWVHAVCAEHCSPTGTDRAITIFHAASVDAVSTAPGSGGPCAADPVMEPGSLRSREEGVVTPGESRGTLRRVRVASL